MSKRKLFYFFLILSLFLLSACGGSGSSNSGATSKASLIINSPMANPAVVLAGQQTNVEISAYLPNASGSTTVQIDLYNGTSFTSIGNMLDEGTNGDPAANDKVYSISVPIREAIANTVTFRIIASDPNNNTATQDIAIPVIQVPTFTSNSDLNQAASDLYNEAIDTRNIFTGINNGTSQSLNQISTNLYDMFGKFESITKQDYGLFDLFDLGENATACRQLEDTYQNNPSDPRLANLEETMAAHYGIDPSYFTDPLYSIDALPHYVQPYILQYQITPPVLGCQGGILKDAANVIVQAQTGEYTDLAGDGMDSMVGSTATGNEQNVYNTANNTATIIGWFNDIFGNKHVNIGQAANKETYTVPAGTYNEYASFGGSTSLAVDKNVTVSSGQTTTAIFTPGSTVGGYMVSGTVTSGGTALPGVNVNLSGFEVASTTTDSYGQYTFYNIANGTYTITPSLTGYDFTPSCTTIAISNADVSGQDFASGSANSVPIGSLKWKYQTGNEIYSSSPAIGNDGTIYIGSEDNYLYAINPDGSLKWKYQTGNTVWSSPAVGSDGTIYVGSQDNYLYALNPDGSLKWKYQTGSGISYSSPAIGSDGTIYIGSNDNYLYAIYPGGALKWRFSTGGGVIYSPVIGSDGTVYAGSGDGYLYAINPDGSQKWKYQPESGVASSPAIGNDGTIYISSWGSYDWYPAVYLSAINPNGSSKWDMEIGSYLGSTNDPSTPAIGSDGTIYVSWGPYLTAVNSAGTLKWYCQIGGNVYPSSPAIGSDGSIYVGAGDNNLYAVNPDGSVKWKYQTGYYVQSSPTIGNDGTIYVGSNDGDLYAIQGSSGLANSAWPMFQHDVRHTGLQ